MGWNFQAHKPRLLLSEPIVALTALGMAFRVVHHPLQNLPRLHVHADLMVSNRGAMGIGRFGLPNNGG